MFASSERKPDPSTTIAREVRGGYPAPDSNKLLVGFETGGGAHFMSWDFASGDIVEAKQGGEEARDPLKINFESFKVLSVTGGSWFAIHEPGSKNNYNTKQILRFDCATLQLQAASSGYFQQVQMHQGRIIASHKVAAYEFMSDHGSAELCHVDPVSLTAVAPKMGGLFDQWCINPYAKTLDYTVENRGPGTKHFLMRRSLDTFAVEKNSDGEDRETKLEEQAQSLSVLAPDYLTFRAYFTNWPKRRIRIVTTPIFYNGYAREDNVLLKLSDGSSKRLCDETFTFQLSNFTLLDSEICLCKDTRDNWYTFSTATLPEPVIPCPVEFPPSLPGKPVAITVSTPGAMAAVTFNDGKKSYFGFFDVLTPRMTAKALRLPRVSESSVTDKKSPPRYLSGLGSTLFIPRSDPAEVALGVKCHLEVPKKHL